MHHCMSAWQSTGVELEVNLEDYDIHRRLEVLYEETVIQKKKTPRELLAFLASHKHETPFEKSAIHFLVTADIASHIHCIKHRIAVSINAESARYKEFIHDKYYLPPDWNQHWQELLDEHSKVGFRLYHECVADLTGELGRKRAKESCRYFLGYNTQINYDVMFNFRSFVHFYNLRHTFAAQAEIADLAGSMYRQIRQIPGDPFGYSCEAFNLIDSSHLLCSTSQ